MTPREDPLRSIADSIADGRSVDWNGAAPGDPDDMEVIRNLKVLETISRLHRSRVPDDPGSSTLRPGDRWGDLEIRERLGGGAFGEVYRAWDPRLQRDVALKVSATKDARVGVREGRLLAKVRHPNVITVHWADERDGRIAMCTELVAGRTLERVLREGGPFGPREAVGIGVDLCRALAEVHRVGLLHGDVKAQNVMREQGGRIVLMDFGSGTGLRTTAGDEIRISGTPLCMAPEVLAGAPPSVASDIYSLGVLLFFLLTGDYPTEAVSMEALIECHREGRTRHLRDMRPDLPGDLVRSIERALSPSPEDRYPSAGRMEQALAGAIGDPAGPKRARWFRAAIAATGLLALASISWWFLGPFVGSAPAYTIDAALYRGHDGMTEPVEAGGQVRPGDSLFLEIEGSIPLWTYVLDRDEKGAAFLLFPLPDHDLANPLSAGSRHRLPGPRDGRESSWQVTSAGGREQLLIVTSPHRLADFEEEIRGLDPAEIGRPVKAVPLSRGATRVLRGIGGVVEQGNPDGSATDDFDALFAHALRLEEAGASVRGVWMRRIDLQNP